MIVKETFQIWLLSICEAFYWPSFVSLFIYSNHKRPLPVLFQSRAAEQLNNICLNRVKIFVFLVKPIRNHHNSIWGGLSGEYDE